MKNFRAFTLAETLITLTIIGVVATMTIATVIKKYREFTLISQLKRDYSILSQVVSELNYEYNGNWNSVTVDEVFDDMVSKIKTVKICRRTTGCFESTPLQYKGGGITGNWNATNSYKFVMNTGEFVKFSLTDNLISSYYDKPVVFQISIDINGLKKPNRVGYDNFIFGIRDGKLIPTGIDNESNECLANKWTYGYDCAYTVLKEGKFLY